MGEPEYHGPADETEIDFAETFLREPRLGSAEGKASTGELRESQPRKLRLFVHKEHKELHEHEPAAREGKSDQSPKDENVQTAKPPPPRRTESSHRVWEDEQSCQMKVFLNGQVSVGL